MRTEKKSKDQDKKKVKLVRDSFCMPKDEYGVIDTLKSRALAQGVAVKKSELLRAGLMALAALKDTDFKAALTAVPTLKTGRPAAPAAVKSLAAPRSATAKTPAQTPAKAAEKAPSAKSARPAQAGEVSKKAAKPSASRPAKAPAVAAPAPAVVTKAPSKSARKASSGPSPVASAGAAAPAAPTSAPANAAD